MSEADEDEPPAPGVRNLTSTGAEATERIGAELAARLAPGDVVLISGKLGTGKTTLVRGLCRALGVSEPVTSPTYTIGQIYRGRTAASHIAAASHPSAESHIAGGNEVTICHLDLYRITDLESEEAGLLDEYLGPDRITLIEWPGVGAESLALAAVRARVEIEHRSTEARELRVECLA